jgi:hypothetical protein
MKNDFSKFIDKYYTLTLCHNSFLYLTLFETIKKIDFLCLSLPLRPLHTI